MAHSCQERPVARPRLAVVTAVPMSLRAFWRTHLRHAQESFELFVVASGADAALVRELGVRATPVDVTIPRRPSPLADLRARRRLVQFFRRERIELVHSQTPKAGWLAMRAARRAGVPVRLHTFTGQVWATAQGPWRWLLRAIDARTARDATTVLADSPSQADFLAAHGVMPRDRIRVIGAGSISGVDSNRFRPDPEARRRVRAEFGVSDDQPVLLFVGRLTRDKGIPELLRAFAELARARPSLQLWLVGPDEGAARLLRSLEPSLRARVRTPGATSEPERFMAAADLLLLPSHREGFGSTVIEAAACGVPSVASRIYGVIDAIVDGETGLLHEVGRADEIARCAGALVDDAARRERLGKNARARAVAQFDPDGISRALVRLYCAERERAHASTPAAGA